MSGVPQKSTISIIGCGWLGLPLAAHLAEIGHKVLGTVTEKERFPKLVEVGIVPFQLLLTEEKQLLPDRDTEFWGSDIFILSLPPKNPEYYPKAIALILSVLKAQKRSIWVIYTSSTGVYGKGTGLLNEASPCNPDRPSAQAVLKAEILLQNSEIECSILRLAGLVGGERQPGRFFAGKKNLDSGSSPVNLVHRDDCIGVITTLIEKNIRLPLLNLSSPEHPVHRNFYPLMALRSGLEAPGYIEDNPDSDNKIIDSTLLIKSLEYCFLYPNPLDFP